MEFEQIDFEGCVTWEEEGRDKLREIEREKERQRQRDTERGVTDNSTLKNSRDFRKR